MSSNDFDGPTFGPAGGRGADDYSGGNGAGAPGAGVSGNGAQDAGKGKYPAPEGWEKDGFWRDSAIDSDYETGLTNAIRPIKDGPRDDPGHSYFADGKGWENSPGKSAAGAGDATSLDATRGNFTPLSRRDATRMDMRGRADGGGAGYYGNGNPTAVYREGPGGPGGPGYGPGGPGGPGGRGPGGPNGPGRGGRRKGSWWRHWTWKKAGAVVGGVFVLFLLAMFGAYQYMSSTTVIPAALASADYQSTQVYYSDGKTLMGTIGVYNRRNLTFNQIPVVLQNAVLAAEDKSFWTEGGISPTGILRAAVHDVTSGGGSLNGGSTITQEFVRNYYDGIGTQQTMSRKIREVFIAQKLAQQKSKQWILTNYLNVIPLGDHALGVAAAAQTYFGIPVEKLSTISIAQAAVIAGIIQQPGLYPLPSYRQSLITRWHYVLDQMVKDRFISQAQADAQKFPKMLTDTTYNPNTGTSFSNEDNGPWAAYLMNVVQNEIEGVDGITATQLETGGMKIVTTISRPMEVQMYKSVKETLSASNIRNTSGSMVSSLPNWIRVGAELQDPKTGEIIAMYPGPGQNMSPAKCKLWDCDLNTAVYAREQVGSSFKPYVLATAVSQGMNVQSSILNANPMLCVPPDYQPKVLSSPKVVVSGNTISCPTSMSSYYAVENDGGEVIGKKAQGYGVSPQIALAMSSNTAFTDLAHRTTTKSVIDMAGQFGVNLAPYSQGGSNLPGYRGQVGMALGIAPLTVNEQTSMLATIADNGVYHTAHLIKYWTLGSEGVKQLPKVESHPALNNDPVLNAQLDSQVQYAMEATTTIGTGGNAAVGLGSRQIIAKTGTTTNSHSGFFIGAIPQYALVVGMFTKSGNTNSADNLAMLGGGGFGGYWPAKIWNSFAMAEFANLPMESFPNAVFSGSKWNQVGKLPNPKKKTKCTVTLGGRKFTFPGKGCKNGTPTPTPTPPGNCHPVWKCPPTGFPTPTSTSTFPGGGTPTATPSSTPTGFPTSSASATASATSTATTGGGPGGLTANGVQAGLALGGVLTVLPGSLLWNSVSRRRKRRRAE